MALTDILRSAYRTAQNIVRPAVLGLALAYCGPTVDDDRGCDTDADCHSSRICNYNTGRCVNPDEGEAEGEELDFDYIWGVGNCESGGEWKGTFEAGNERFVREFSREQVPQDGYGERFDSYQCALSRNPNLYVFEQNGEVRLVDNLYLLTNEPYPGTKACRSQQWTQDWYVECFQDHEP